MDARALEEQLFSFLDQFCRFLDDLGWASLWQDSNDHIALFIRDEKAADMDTVCSNNSPISLGNSKLSFGSKIAFGSFVIGISILLYFADRRFGRHKAAGKRSQLNAAPSLWSNVDLDQRVRIVGR